MLVNTLLRNVNRNMQTMQKKQDQLSTGKRVSAPSDDPVAVSKILKYKTKINELEQYDKNSKDALSWTQTSELAIKDISDALGRARELAVQGANETNSDDERRNIAMEVRQLKEHIIGNANKTFAGKYIFSSFQTDKKLLNDDGTFNINVTQKELLEKPTTTYEVGVGETMKVSTNGVELFGAIEDTSNFATKIPTGLDEGDRATNAVFIGENFNREIDHSGDTLEFSVDGTTYTVDMTGLNGLVTPITNEAFKTAVLNADDGGGNLLSDVAEVTFNADNALVVESKIFGAVSNIDYLNTSTDIFDPQDPADPAISGTDLVESEILGTINMDDADIAADTGIKKMVIEYYGETKVIEMDMDSYTDVANFVTDLETEINNAYSDKITALNQEAGTTGQYGISVTGSTGNPIEFRSINSVAFHNNTANGETVAGTAPSLNIRPIKSEKPEMMQVLDDFIEALETYDTDGINTFLSEVDDQLQNVNASRSEIGAKTNRLEMILSRIGDDSINVTQLLSNSQDVDMAETIMLLKNAENVYKASLSGGARVIQPSLLDFLR